MLARTWPEALDHATLPRPRRLIAIAGGDDAALSPPEVVRGADAIPPGAMRATRMT